jgi:O-antigen/teichoic acid export membrane protein
MRPAELSEPVSPVASGPRPTGWLRYWALDSALLLSSQVLTVLATTLTAILVARSLAPDIWGVFSAFLGVSLALAVVIVFGLATWLLRELATLFTQGDDDAARREASRLICSGIALNLLLAAPLLVTAAVYATVAGYSASTWLALVLLLVYGGLIAIAATLETQLRARRRVARVAAASLLEKGVLLVLVVAVVVLDLGIAVLGVCYVVAALTRITYVGARFFWRERAPVVVPSLRRVRTVARATAPFAISAGALNVVPRFDTAVVAALSTTSAGWFAIADRALGPALLVPATVASTLFPFLARRSQRATEPWKLAGALALVGAALAALGIALAPTLVPLIFGDDYEDAVPVTQVMLLVLPLAYAASPLLVFAYSQGRERTVVLVTIALSLVGTLAVAVGQAAGGAQLAALGVVVRSALFLGGIAAVALIVRTQPPHEAVVPPSPESM